METQHPPHRRAQRCATLLCVLALLVAGLGARQFIAHAANTTLNWSLPPSNLTNTDKGYTPRIAVDKANHYHIIYNTEDDLLYINNVSGSFSQPQSLVSKIGGNPDRFYDMTIAPDDTLHVVYSQLGGEALKGEPPHGYYIKGTLNGASATWSQPLKVTPSDSDVKGFMSSVVVDKAGNIHLAWFDKSKATYNVGYRVLSAGGTLGPIQYPRIETASENLSKNVMIAITNDNKVHLAYARGTDILYARLDGTTWTTQKLSSSRSFAPALTTDGTNLYAFWDGDGMSFRRSLDGGNTWSNVIAIASKDVRNTYAEVTWAAATKRVYLVWGDQTGYAASESSLDIWYREFDPADATTTDARQLLPNKNISSWPEIRAGPNEAALVWQEDRDINFTTSVIKPKIVCKGTLVLENGAAATKNATVTGAITPASDCTPEQMQLSLDTPPTDATDKVAYTSQVSVPVPQSGCTHTVYTRLFVNGDGGDVLSDNIKVATTVNAAVQAMNPHMAGAPAYTALATADFAPQAGEAGGASDGAPNYTRDRSVVVSLSSSCVDLKSFAVAGSTGSAISGARYVGALPLPGDPLPGAKQLAITVTDTLSNTQPYSYSMIYDPADTDPSTVATDTLGLPVLGTGAGVEGDANTKSILRTLTFSNTSVTDNIYGRAEGLAAGKQFWGVWVANSRDDNAQDNPNLVWTPVRVPSPDAAFSVAWNLFTGLGYGVDTTKTGDYYVYVRVLDGAGNPSQGFVKAKLTLDAGYQLSTLYLPLTAR